MRRHFLLSFFIAISVPKQIPVKLLILNYLAQGRIGIKINFSLRRLKFLYISSKTFQAYEEEPNQYLITDYWI